MMKRFFGILTAGVLVLGIGAATLSTPVAAQNFNGGAPAGVEDAKGNDVPTNISNGDGSLIRKIVNILLYIIGVLSVIMLIFGGFRYVISGGKSEQVTAAKNTILYAIVGLLIAIFSYAIIQFVMNAVTGSGGVDV